MVQVQLRIPEESVSQIDKQVKKGVFKSRSDAIKAMITVYQEREKTREFYKMLIKRSEEAKEKPENLVAFDDL